MECNDQSIISGKFPDLLKDANISSVYKAKDPFDKTSYKPVIDLPLL